MTYFWNKHNFIYRFCAIFLILLHLATFGPIREALAFSASSASYKLNSSTLNEGGKDRSPTYTKLLTHFDGSLGATTFTDEVGHTITNNAANDSYNVLGLELDGADGSTVFTDSSANKTVTANGNAQIDTAQSKFGSASGLFDGNGDYLSLADSDDWSFGSSDFTIETWVKLNTTGIYQVICSQRDDANTDWYLRVNTDNSINFYGVSGGTVVADFVSPALTWGSSWHHIAVVRSGNMAYIFFDGVSQPLTVWTAFSANALPNSTSALWIGAQNRVNYEYYFSGWLDELRISKGIARWTSNFTPPQGKYGGVSVDTTQSKFGGASALFDGEGDYLSLADSDDWNFGSGDFTIDFWVRFNDLTDEIMFMSQASDGDNEWYITKNSNATENKLQIVFRSGAVTKASYIMTNAWSGVAVNTWYHLAFVRNGTTALIFIDGVSQTLTENTAFSVNDVGNLAATLYVGARGAGSQSVNGWIDEFRISKGIARWTANFTPPQAPYTIDEPDAGSLKLWQDSLGEPAIGRLTSSSYLLSSGYIPTIQSNPPILKQNIPYQTWAVNSSKENAFDLDDYFESPEGYQLSYSVSGNSNITININPDTHIVSFSQSPDYFGIEEVYFLATDTDGASTQSNKVVLQVENTTGPDKPAIVSIGLNPSIIREGDLVTLTVKARDLDNDSLTFAYSDFFNQVRTWQEGELWVSEATWQTALNDTGHYIINITATDSTGLTGTDTASVNVGNLNRPPVINPIAGITANEGDLVTVAPVVSDPDNDAINLYYSVPLNSRGFWLTDFDDAGTYDVTVTASDGIDTVTQGFKITINNTNQRPLATLTLSKYTANPNEEITIRLDASDPDGDALTFSLKKDGAEIASGSINSTYSTTTSFSSSGDHALSATVTDSGALSATDAKGIDVVDPNANRDVINPVMGDFDGDSLTDLGLHNSESGAWEICISDKGTFRNAADWLTNFGASNSRDWWSLGGDFNGDGKTDAAVYNNTNGQLMVATSAGLSNRSTGAGSFANQGVRLTFTEASYSWQITTGNFNADKYIDIAFYNKDTGEVKVALGRENLGFGAFSTWLTGFGTDYIALSGDFNGDSLSDLCLFKKSSGEFKVAFSNTLGFVDGRSWLSGFATDKDPLLSDFNNDGLTDIGYWDKTSGNWYYATSTGEIFVNQGVWLSSFGNSSDESASTGDFDGNGITDQATFDRDNLGINRWRTRLSTNKPADLLTQIDNGIGGKTQIYYTYSSDFPGNDDLPFPVYVAKSISLIDTLPADQPQETYTQNFSYSGGYFDFQEREFRGFNKVTVTDPISNNYTETYFYQGKGTPDDNEGALKGQIQKLIAYDGNNRIISQTLNTYEVRKSGPGQDRVLGFPALTETTTTVYEENGTSLATKDTFIYDSIGNPLEQANYGDLAKIGDEKATATIYAQAYETGFNRPLEASLKDKDGNTVSKKNFEYDAKGNLNKEKLLIYNPLTTDYGLSTTDYSYDSFGNLTQTTNALGATVITEYETEFSAYPVKITNSLGHTIQYVYDYKLGVVTSVTDANSQTTTTTYDSLGRVTKQGLSPTGTVPITVATYSYPDFNTKITTNAINLSSTEYIDGIGRKYRTVSPGEDGTSARAISTEAYFNNRGFTDRESLPHYEDEITTDPNPTNIAYIRYKYDTRGRVVETISDFAPSEQKPTEQYSASPLDARTLVSYITPLYTETQDPELKRKGALKDVFGNIVEVREFVSGEPQAQDGAFRTYYEYDIQNNLTKTTDNLGNITQIFYDSIGRKLKMIDPDMGTWFYEYDILGNLVKQTDAKGQVLTFEYDQLNRLTTKKGLSPEGGLSLPLATYFYDGSEGLSPQGTVPKENIIGRLSKVADTSGSTEFFYDQLGREIKSVKGLSPQGTDPYTEYQVLREYDILDRLTKLTYPDGEVVNYSYDGNSGLLAKVEGLSPQGTVPYVRDITYNAKGQIKDIQYGNNTSTNYTYGQDLRLSRIQTQNSQLQTLQDLNYDFDKNGNILQLYDALRSNNRTFAYDDLDRLIQANDLPSPNGGLADYFYQYDSIGNITRKTEGGATISMEYGQNAGPHALTFANGYTYQYDANGNMTVGKNKTLSYDIENRLTQVNELGTISTFTYDGDGGRVRKGLSRNGTVPDEWTTYIGSLFEVDSDGTIRKHIFAGANRVATISLSLGGEGQGEGAISYYHSDHLGSSSIVTDASGAQVQYLEYTPYGSTARNEISQGLSPTGTVPVKHLFTGKELDSTGLYFYGARYYDPEIGRFITADTIVQAPYDPQSLNRYAYCRNNPINYVDPSGHSWEQLIWFIILFAVSYAVVQSGGEVQGQPGVTIPFDTGPSTRPSYSSSNPPPSSPQASNADINSSSPSSGVSTGGGHAEGSQSSGVSNPFLLPEMEFEPSAVTPYENDNFALQSSSFPSLSMIGLIASGIKGGASKVLKNSAKIEETSMEIFKRNAILLEKGKATPVVLLDRVAIRSKPYKWAGKAAGALSIAAIGLDVKSIWSQSNLTTGQKWAKTGIYGTAVGISYGVGVLTSPFTPIVSIAAATVTGVALEYGKQQLYRRWDLE